MKKHLAADDAKPGVKIGFVTTLSGPAGLVAPAHALKDSSAMATRSGDVRRSDWNPAR
jgi:hypothetical protein